MDFTMAPEKFSMYQQQASPSCRQQYHMPERQMRNAQVSSQSTVQKNNQTGQQKADKCMWPLLLSDSFSWSRQRSKQNQLTDLGRTNISEVKDNQTRTIKVRLRAHDTENQQDNKPIQMAAGVLHTKKLSAKTQVL